MKNVSENIFLFIFTFLSSYYNIIYIVQHAIHFDRGRTLQKKAEELHKITNARIKLIVIQLTDRGTPFNYESPNFHFGVMKVTLKKNKPAADDTLTSDEEQENDVIILFYKIGGKSFLNYTFFVS